MTYYSIIIVLILVVVTNYYIIICNTCVRITEIKSKRCTFMKNNYYFRIVEKTKV